jgi:hypothetical protein
MVQARFLSRSRPSTQRLGTAAKLEVIKREVVVNPDMLFSTEEAGARR